MVAEALVDALFAGELDVVDVAGRRYRRDGLQWVLREVRRRRHRRRFAVGKCSVESKRRLDGASNVPALHQYLRGISFRSECPGEGAPVGHTHGELDDVAGAATRGKESAIARDAKRFVWWNHSRLPDTLRLSEDLIRRKRSRRHS